MKKIFTFLSAVAIAATMNAQVVINEVYGGGGNTGATLTHDFIELYNAGSTPISLSGLYLWYGSATGALGGQDGALVQALPDFTLEPGKFYLIQQAKGNGGTVALPTPDFTPTNAFNMSGTSFKVALTNSNVAPTAADDSNVVDFVGAGTANLYEGTAAAPAASNTTSVSRTDGVDTNNNSVDFTVGTPTPTNGTLAVSDVDASKLKFIKNTLVDQAIDFSAKANVKIYNVNGQMVKEAAVNNGTRLDVSNLAKGMYIVAGEVDGQAATAKIIKK